MKTIYALILLLMVTTVTAQIPVTDAANISQSIVNSTQELAQTTTTASNMIKNFQETQKIYNQAKGFYDALKAVKNLIRDAKKVQQTILYIGEISDIYVENYQKMLTDKNYSVEELNAIAFGYSELLQKSTDILQELKSVVNEVGFSMSDAERMEIIDKCHATVRNYRNLIRYYTNKCIMVSYLRCRQKEDMYHFISLYSQAAEEKYW
jgi:hypothetical protein